MIFGMKEKAYLFSFQLIHLNFQKLTLITGFVLQGHIWLFHRHHLQQCCGFSCRCSRSSSQRGRSTSRLITAWRRATGSTSWPKSVSVTASVWALITRRRSSTDTGSAASCLRTRLPAALHAQGESGPVSAARRLRILTRAPPKVWKHPWQIVVLDDISINPYHCLVQILYIKVTWHYHWRPAIIILILIMQYIHVKVRHAVMPGYWFKLDFWLSKP